MAEIVEIDVEIPSHEVVEVEAQAEDKEELCVELESQNVIDHEKTYNREKPNQHPMGAITGLVSALDGKQPVGEYATAAQGAKADTAIQPNDNVSELTNDAGYITGITSLMVTTALGYTPYNSTNPNGYQTAAQVNTAISGYHDSTKQDQLVSGTNIKTINNQSILGGGNIEIQEGSTAKITINKHNQELGSFTLNQNEDGSISISPFAGQFLGMWDSIRGKFEFDPVVESYDYKVGDYIIISQATNGYCYLPGNSYPETIRLSYTPHLGDIYCYYSQNYWVRLYPSLKWSDISGSISESTALSTAFNAKQDLLSSGVNIKTIDGQSLLGGGDIVTQYNGTQGIYIQNNSIGIIQSKELLSLDKVGNPTIDVNDNISDITTSDYFYTKNVFSTHDLGEWVITTKITTPSDVSGRNAIIGSKDAQYNCVALFIEGGKFGFNIRDFERGITVSRKGDFAVQPNTTYWVRLKFDYYEYYLYYSTDGVNYTRDVFHETPTYTKGGYKFTFGVEVQNSITSNAFAGTLHLKDWLITINDETFFDGNNLYSNGPAKATNDLYGLVKPDGTTITIDDGVISATASSPETITNEEIDTIWRS